MNRHPANTQKDFAQGTKGLVMGIVDGVTGVVVEPVSGAKQQGLNGFFKGIGKGVVGLVTKPAVGVVGFASGSVDAVKRVGAGMHEEVTTLKPPPPPPPPPSSSSSSSSFSQQHAHLNPNVHMEAEGNKLLQVLAGGKYAITDVYLFHMSIGPTNKDILMLTDKRVIYIMYNGILGKLQVGWDYTWESLIAPPHIIENGIFISTWEPRKEALGFSGHGGKVIPVEGQERKEWLANKMTEIMVLLKQ